MLWVKGYGSPIFAYRKHATNSKPLVLNVSCVSSARQWFALTHENLRVTAVVASVENLREGVSLPQWDVSASGVTSGPVVLAEVMPVFMELTMMQRPTPKQASDLGDRIILAPLAINPRLADTAIHQLARDFADGNRKGDSTLEADPVNVVILVPSDAAAAR